MNSIKLAALLLIGAGVLALVYGSFSYTKDTSAVKIGPLELGNLPKGKWRELSKNEVARLRGLKGE